MFIRVTPLADDYGPIYVNIYQVKAIMVDPLDDGELAILVLDFGQGEDGGERGIKVAETVDEIFELMDRLV